MFRRTTSASHRRRHLRHQARREVRQFQRKFFEEPQKAGIAAPGERRTCSISFRKTTSAPRRHTGQRPERPRLVRETHRKDSGGNFVRLFGEIWDEEPVGVLRGPRATGGRLLVLLHGGHGARTMFLGMFVMGAASLTALSMSPASCLSPMPHGRMYRCGRAPSMRGGGRGDMWPASMPAWCWPIAVTLVRPCYLMRATTMHLNRREMIAALSALGLVPSAFARETNLLSHSRVASPAATRTGPRDSVDARHARRPDGDVASPLDSCQRSRHEAGPSVRALRNGPAARFHRQGRRRRARSRPHLLLSVRGARREVADRPHAHVARRPRRSPASRLRFVRELPARLLQRLRAHRRARRSGFCAASRRLPVRIQTRRVLGSRVAGKRDVVPTTRSCR